MEERNMEIVGYYHSGCCGAHWELVVTSENEYKLVCEQCERPLEIEIATIPKPFSCAICGSDSD